MIRLLLIPIAVSSLTYTTVPSRAIDQCLARATGAAESATTQVMQELGVIVADDVITSLVEETAKETCDPALNISNVY